jgi:hypothetical protein
MLAARALQSLASELATMIAGMGLSSSDFGRPELVEVQVRQTEATFQGFSKSKPDGEDAYFTARAFLQGQELDAWQRDLVASAVATPIREHAKAVVLGSPRFDALLGRYEADALQDELSTLTWHGLLYSYFNFDVSGRVRQADRSGWEALRDFLNRTWPLIDRQAGTVVVPEWIRVLRTESAILGGQPAGKYAQAYLQGDTRIVDRVSADLGIPTSSWFWHELVLGAVKHAAMGTDAAFQEHIPKLLQLITGKPGFRDEALEIILIRYHQCRSAPPHGELRDYVCQPGVWKNPKLRAAGIATAWNRVPDPVWQMMLGWVNERNLKDFFDILAARNSADEGRLAFWSNYLKQITWTRLVFGAETMALKTRNAGVRDLIAREEGAYAELTGKREVDAFMIRIGGYLIVEFSKKPNACYVYKMDKVPFDPYHAKYDGGTDDLAAGYNQQHRCAARVVHRHGWQYQAQDSLDRLGIHPDPYQPPNRGAAAASPSQPTLTSPPERPPSEPPRPTVSATDTPRPAASPGVTGASGVTPMPVRGPDIGVVRQIVDRYYAAKIDDQRKTYGGGRLWVIDPLDREPLSAELKALGFKWAGTQNAWYYPES